MCTQCVACVRNGTGLIGENDQKINNVMLKQAIISAGGLGTRLRPYTDMMPKPMISILGKPMLEWHIEQFKKFDITEFFVTLYYLPHVIINYFGDGSKFGVKMNYFIEKEP